MSSFTRRADRHGVRSAFALMVSLSASVQSTSVVSASIVSASLVSASVVSASPAVAASPGGAGQAGDRPTARTASGFVPQHTPLATPLALHSTRAGELWVLERDDDGRIVLEHLRGGTWRTIRLDGTVTSFAESVDLTGSAWNDVWLATGSELWRFDGRTWRKVALPPAADGGRVSPVKITDVRGQGVYVGTHDDGVFRRVGQRWVALGKPRPQGEPRFPGQRLDRYWPVGMGVHRGQLYVSFEWFQQRAVHQLYRYDRSGWTQLGDSMGSRGSSASEIPRAWMLWDDGRGRAQFLTAGTVRAQPGPIGGLCAAWRSGAAPAPCTTTQAVGGGAVRGDGRIVLAGTDFRDPSRENAPWVQGRFVLRDDSGVEKTVSGDPGDETIAVATEPGTRTSWALTRTGSQFTLQRWAG